MKVSKSTVCRICAQFKDGECSKGEDIGPYRKEDCWTFKHKSETLNLASCSETNGSSNNWNA